MSLNWSTAQLVDAYKRQGIPCAIQQACGDGRKPHKYHAEPVTIDGHRFDSKLEARHYYTLKIAAEKGWISDLTLQPKFVLQPKMKLASGKTQRAIVYKGDFQFVRDGKTVVVDVKSEPTKTAAFRIKWKMVQALHPEIQWETWGQ
jgi:hypothetical protein